MRWSRESEDPQILSKLLSFRLTPYGQEEAQTGGRIRPAVERAFGIPKRGATEGQRDSGTMWLAVDLQILGQVEA